MTSMNRILSLALALFAITACSKKVDTVCEEKCAAADVAACQTASEESEATAEERGCEGDFESLVSCVDANATCVAGGLLVVHACAAEIAALEACMK